MANQNKRLKKIGGWFGDIANLAALVAIAIVVIELIYNKNRVILLSALGILTIIVLLKYADVGRFTGAIASQEEIPPLGLARGSVRAFLAFGILVGFGLYIYYVTIHAKTNDIFNPQIFTALGSIMSAVIGFYFGSRSTAAVQPAVRPSAPNITGILPPQGKAGSKVRITNLAGTGFQTDATVNLVRDTDNIHAEEVNVVQSTKITCIFNLPQDAQKVKWDVVVTNPDSQTGTLPEAFEIT